MTILILLAGWPMLNLVPSPPHLTSALI